MTDSELFVQFWGVRGSVPTPGPNTVRYGGNTSCIEVRVGGKHLIFDGGTGLRMLGQKLETEIPPEVHLLFTHYHWDHIQGVPFFIPIFRNGKCLHVHGRVPPEGEQMNMQEHFYHRVLHRNSPLGADIAKLLLNGDEIDLKFNDLVCSETFTIGDIVVETQPLNHPNGAMGYRVNWQGKSIVYCTDTEHFPDRLDENILYLARDADLLIYDAMYTDEEYYHPQFPKIGWGHSTWEEGVKIAKAAGVKQLAIFHHEPNHDDDFLDKLAVEAKEVFDGAFVAREKLVVSI